MLKEVSPDSFAAVKLVNQLLGKSCSHWSYKEQRPNVALWGSSDAGEPALVQQSPGQMQQLLLQTDGTENKVHVPQLALSLVGQGGCYRQQTAELPLLLSSVTVDGNQVSEDESLPSPSAALLLSVSTGNSFPGESNTEWWMSSGSVSHPENKFYFLETQETQKLTAAKDLSCTKLDNVLSQDTISDRGNGFSLTTLFKDLNLKVLWDQEDENAEFY